MTTDQPETPVPAFVPVPFDYDAWRAEEAKRRAEFAAQLIPLKAALFDFLEVNGIVLVTVDFDGCGDSGQIEGITAFDEHGEVALPVTGFVAPDADGAAADASGPIEGVIDTLAEDQRAIGTPFVG